MLPVFIIGCIIGMCILLLVFVCYKKCFKKKSTIKTHEYGKVDDTDNDNDTLI